MIAVIVGLYERISSHEWSALMSRLPTTELVVVSPKDDTATGGLCDMNSFVSSLTATMNYEESPPPEPHINGSLRYLYLDRKALTTKVVQRRHPIKQPCWRAGRWKSLT